MPKKPSNKPSAKGKKISGGMIKEAGSGMDFPVVGVGSSAGGLKALESFFSHVPTDKRISFIIVQHLDAKHKSLVPSILRKFTALPVDEISETTAIQPNRIYCKPPGMDVTIKGGSLLLSEQNIIKGINLPVDTLFKSMAEDLGERSIGILLSGSGRDGTIGVQAIKAAGGMCMVQDEREAEFGEMPGNAYATGLVDFKLKVAQMPPKLMEYIDIYHNRMRADGSLTERQVNDIFQKILLQVKIKTGHDFFGYKKSTVLRRIERRIAIHGLGNMRAYLTMVQSDDEEAGTLFKDLLIGVTSFFREPESLALVESLLAEKLRTMAHGASVRAWVPGCSTGEEAYTYAILFAEIVSRHKLNLDVQIFGTDIDEKAIDFARAGVYPEGVLADLPVNYAAKYFIRGDSTLRVKKGLRDMIIFAKQSLIQDPPFSHLDMVSCRNVLIYLEPEMQKRIIPLFHYTLNKGGLLVLGDSESIGEFASLFRVHDKKIRVFTRIDQPDRVDYGGVNIFDLPESIVKGEKMPHFAVNAGRTIERIVLEEYSPPSIVVNGRGEIIYFIGRTDRYFAMPSGEPVFNALRMARDGLAARLKSAMKTVSDEMRVVRYNDIRVKSNGSYIVFDMVARPLSELPASLDLIIVLFYEKERQAEGHKNKKNAGEKTSGNSRVVSLEQELKTTKDYLQATVEEMETSNEELKSANEEMQSVNEELKSTNEELETSKEELQATNEELVTVNAELQRKVEELSDANNDINNLLAGTDIATVFLDADLKIKRFTPAMSRIYNVIESDIGRPISDITANIIYPSVYADSRQVLDTLVRKEAEVRDAAGSWYKMQILPYRTVENVIDGVVISFLDITDIKGAKIIESVLSALKDVLFVLDRDLKVVQANRTYYRLFNTDEKKTIGAPFYELGRGIWGSPELRSRIEDVVNGGDSLEDYPMDLEVPEAGNKRVVVNASRMDINGYSPLIVIIVREAAL